MKKIKLTNLACAVLCVNMHAQLNNANHLVFPPTPNPPLSTVHYTRAAQSISLQCQNNAAFHYGLTGTGISGFLNLSISPYPPFVNSAYLGSAINPRNNTCGTTPGLDINKPVGETVGFFNVSDKGAASYDIPIQVSPGTSDMAPSLSIGYNSQAGLGLLGIGWHLNGFSILTRSNKTPYFDNVSAGPLLNATDVFALDGNRLFSLTGTYGQHNTQYYTEQESFAKITSYGMIGNGPEKFEVIDKNGQIIQFGFTPDSRLQGQNNGQVFGWYQNKVTDEFGNYMNFSYKQLNAEVLLDKIEYTGNAAAQMAPYNKVTFDYIPLAEKNTSYINGAAFNQTQLLKEICCWAGNKLFKKYVMDYEWKEGTYLAQVIEVDAGGRELNPSLFCYAKPDDMAAVNTSTEGLNLNFSTADYVDLIHVPVDFNGDGFSDVACFNPSAGRMHVYQNNFVNSSNSTINFTKIFDNTSQVGTNESMLCSAITDQDKNGRQELYCLFAPGTSTTNGHLYSNQYYVLKAEMNTGNSIIVSNLGTYSTMAAFDLQTAPGPFLFNVQDYTGDGANDVLRIDHESINLTVGGNSHTFLLPNSANTFAKPFNYDNDEKSEYIILTTTGTVLSAHFVKFTGNTLAPIPGATIHIPFPNNGILQKNLLKHISFGDFNGDGIDDLVYMNNYVSELWVCYGTGQGFTAAKQIQSFTALNIANEFDLSCVDVNADGKMDILVSEVLGGNNNTNYFAYLSFGEFILKGGTHQGNWSAGHSTKILYNSDLNLMNKHNRVMENTSAYNAVKIPSADFNGDGVFDYANIGSGGNYIVTNNMNGEVRQLLSKIYTPMRNNFDITYTNIGGHFRFTPNGKEEVLKPINQSLAGNFVQTYAPNMYCVSQVTELSGHSGQFNRTKKYVYENPLFHPFGKGLMCFEKIHAIDIRTNIGTQLTYSICSSVPQSVKYSEINGKYQALQIFGMQNTIGYQLNSAHLMSQTLNTVIPVPTHANAIAMQLQQSETTDFLNSKKQSIAYIYNNNANGQIQSETEKNGWNMAAPLRVRTSVYTYLPINNVFHLSKVSTQQVQTGMSAYQRETEYFYDNLGHLVHIIKDQNVPGLSNHALHTGYSQFNAFGKAKVTAMDAPDVPTRSITVDYDATGRFVTTRTNASGNSEYFVNDPAFGLVTQHTAADGLVTTYVYDCAGRLIQSNFPNHCGTKWHYTWENPNNYPYASQPIGAYAVTTEKDQAPYEKEYYCGNGLLLREESQDMFGQVVISDKAYASSHSLYPDATLLEETENHYPGQSIYGKTKYDYDLQYFRPEAVKAFTMNAGSETFIGHYTQTSYNTPSSLSSYHGAFSETINQSGQKIKKYSNAAGQLVMVMNESNNQQQTATYTYHSNGEPLTIAVGSTNTPGTSALHNYVYNGLGQKISATDPSHGTCTFQYNTIGELLQQSDANGSYTFAYDNLGRLVSKAGSQSGTYTYQYLQSGNGLGKLWKVTGPNHSTEYTYNSLNQLLQSKESIPSDNKQFVTAFSYDLQGRELTHIYPNGYATRNTYNALGYITAISDNTNTNLWELKKTDALNRFIEYAYGNGIVTKNTYNALNQLEEIEHGSIHKQYYAYDPLNGNLNWRRYRNFSTNTDNQEFYGIDNHARLTQSALYDAANNTFPIVTNVTYDAMGNISHKDDAGDYHYGNSANPFQLTQMTNVSANLSLNTLSLNQNDFNKVQDISEMGSNKHLSLEYGSDEERIRSEYVLNGNTQFTRYYAENLDRQETTNGYKEWTYIFAPGGLCAIHYNNNGNNKLMYVNTDHLGSPILLTGTVGTNAQAILEENAFDAWGRRRNPTDWTYNNISNTHLIPRGFTFHEHIDEFSLINMNGRIYDGVLGRFLQPDNYVQAPDNLQNFNRYAYCLNNPLTYNDPSGNIIAFTDRQYEYWKSHSDIAIKINLGFGSDVKKAGFEVSYGIPKSNGLYIRGNAGVNYYWQDVDHCYKGWEATYGVEAGGAVPLHFGENSRLNTLLSFNIAVNHYDREGRDFDQTTSKVSIGGTKVNAQYENDFMFGLPCDGGDGLRTAAAKLSFGKFSLGFNLFTGDPGGAKGLFGLGSQRNSGYEREVESINGQLTYVNNGAGGDPDKYRAGIAYAQYGSIKVGRNSEKIRNAIQNKAAHDFLFPMVSHGEHMPHFRVLDRKATWYFSLGSGNASGLW